MKRTPISYQNGQPVCEYRDNYQIIHYDSTQRMEHVIQGKRYTREVMHLNNGALIVATSGFSHDPKTNITTGWCYGQFDQTNHKTARKLTIDFNTGIETIARDKHGNGVYQISQFDLKDNSTLKVTEYYPSGHIKSIQNQKNNLPHGTQLLYEDGAQPLPNNTLAAKPGRLICYQRYDNGFQLYTEVFKDGMSVMKKIHDKIDPDNVRKEIYSYYDDNSYQIQYANKDHIYYAERRQGDKVLRSVVFDKDQHIIAFTKNKFSLTTIQEQHTGRKFTYENKYSTVYLPDQWSENGDFIAGIREEYNEDILTSAGSFVKQKDEYPFHGMRLYSHGEVEVYNQGKVVDTYYEKAPGSDDELLRRVKNPQPK